MRRIPTCCAGLVTAVHLSAQAPATDHQGPGPDMDQVSRAALTRWESLVDHPGRSGLKTLAFTVQVTSKSPLGEVTARGSYRSARGKGTLKWDDAGRGGLLAGRGFDAPGLDRMFAADSLGQDLAKASLRGAKGDDGSITVTVEGETRLGYRSLAFDPKGVLRSYRIRTSLPGGVSGPGRAPGQNRASGEAAQGPGDPIEVEIRVDHDKVGDRYLRTGWGYRVKRPAGLLEARVEIRHRVFGRHRVPVRVVETVTLDGEVFGTNTLEFAEWVLNGVPAGDEEAPPADGGPKRTPSPRNGSGKRP